MMVLAEFRLGWRNLGAATVGLGTGIACYTPVSSLFLQALGAEFGWSRAASAGAFIALPITAAILGPVGLLIDRRGVRPVVALSTAALVACFFWLASLSGDIREYYAATIALFVTGCATGPVAYTRLVAAQFNRSRGAALAVAQFGIALVAIILPPVIAAAISQSGWRAAYLLIAGVTALGGLAAMAFMRPVAPGPGPEACRAGLSPGEAVVTPEFWKLGMAMMLISAASLGLVTQLSAVLTDRGVGQAIAPWLLSLVALSVMVSRLFTGVLLDRRRPQRWAACVIALSGLGLAILLLVPPSFAATAIAVALVGCSIGAELDLLSYFCARQFGVRHYSANYGFLSAFYLVGIAAGGIAYGAVRDRTGSYDLALAIGSGLLALAAHLLLALRDTDEGRFSEPPIS